jgi:hypothetical protein
LVAPPSELEALAAKLATAAPETPEPVTESEAAEAVSIEIPSEDIVEEEVAEPALSVMEEADFDDEPVSDWPIWNPPLNDEIVEPVVLQHELAASAPAESNRAEPGGTRPELVAKVVGLMSSARSRLAHDRKLFWRVATVTGIAAVSILLFGAAWHRRSPLPTQLNPAAQATSPATADSSPLTPASHVDSEPLDRDQAAPLPVKQVVKRHRTTSYADEENLIAPDTVVRFDHPANRQPSKRVTRSARRKPARASGNDIIAKDTVVRYTTNSQPKE